MAVKATGTDFNVGVTVEWATVTKSAMQLRKAAAAKKEVDNRPRKTTEPVHDPIGVFETKVGRYGRLPVLPSTPTTGPKIGTAMILNLIGIAKHEIYWCFVYKSPKQTLLRQSATVTYIT